MTSGNSDSTHGLLAQLQDKEWVAEDDWFETPDEFDPAQDQFCWTTDTHITRGQIQLATDDPDVEVGDFEVVEGSPAIRMTWVPEDQPSDGLAAGPTESLSVNQSAEEMFSGLDTTGRQYLKGRLNEALDCLDEEEPTPSVEYCIDCDEIYVGQLPDCSVEHTHITQWHDNPGIHYWVECIDYLEENDLI